MKIAALDGRIGCLAIFGLRPFLHVGTAKPDVRPAAASQPLPSE